MKIVTYSVWYPRSPRLFLSARHTQRRPHRAGLTTRFLIRESTVFTGQGVFSPGSCSYSAVSFMFFSVNLKYRNSRALRKKPQ